MGGGMRRGHVSLGLAFLMIGLWHLFSSIKHHSLHPNSSYATQPWHPASQKLRHFEPITIMLVTAAFISSELTIFSRSRLPHLEHSVVALSFFVQSLFSILLDKTTTTSTINKNTRGGLVHFLQALAFGQQLLILHLHSTDHAGLEGHYHWLLQVVTSVSLATTVLAALCPGSFVNAFARAFSVVFQGVWLVVTGVMLWSPGLMPEGCFMRPETGRVAVLCHGDEALDRAKALVNIQFGMYLTALTVFSMSLYVVMVRCYCDPQQKVEYAPLTKVVGEEECS